jgi:TetR/AcrR family transcriptional repressor of mexCD-oprJ operon
MGTVTNERAGGRRRADATRNIAAILEAGLACLGDSAEVNMAEIARTAGVGRVTLYGHFPSKEALVDAVVAHAIGRANAALDDVDLASGPAPQALARLATSSWQILNQHRQLMVAGQRHLGAARMRTHHDQAMARVEELIARGQTDGTIRTDLPLTWLVTTFYALLHAAAEDVNAGRLKPTSAGDLVAATILSALTATAATPSSSL